MTDIEQLKRQAKSYFESGAYEKSFELCKKMIALDPENPGHYLKAGSNLQELGQYKRAQKFYDKAISIDPENALAFSGRGMIQTELGDVDQAIGSFTRAIELSPSFPHFYTQRAVLLLQQALDNCTIYMTYLKQRNPLKAATYRAKCIAKLKRGASDLTLAQIKGSDSPTLPDTLNEITSFIDDLESEKTDKESIVPAMNRLEKGIIQMQ